MELPVALLQSLEGVPGFHRETFEAVHRSGEQVTSVRVNPAKAALLAAGIESYTISLPISGKIPWTENGYYLKERPFFTFDPLLHAGAYYVQEASSMFVEQAMRQTLDLNQKLRVLDGCAAPGGKSTHLQSLISSDSLLVSNEVIKTRASILEENLVKWGGTNVIVTNNDPSDFTSLPNFFDVMLIDAPCSGSGLFRREPEAIAEWSPHAVQLCSQRQQRILADYYPALAEGGTLIYSTCSYSREEDEQIIDWLMQTFDLESLPLQLEDDWGIVEVQSPGSKGYGYRFFPDQLRGEGFFLAAFRKKDGDAFHYRTSRKPKLQKASKTETAAVMPWLREDAGVHLWKQQEQILAFPALLEQELQVVADNLYLRHAGITVGKLAGTQLVPDHSLAMSTLLAPATVAVSLKKEDALQYLRKEQVILTDAPTGWALVKYEDLPLGWVKILPNRVNNYYPSNWRILKSGSN
ncbi:MAG: RNA methyltransferase [Chitinophagaceae bacterium]|nr:RNA methyltransferase [Chitinophagaceae bacterium]